MNSPFETIKKINEYEQEFWFARELSKTLEYKDFGNFENVIKKAKISCENSGQSVLDHFSDATEMVAIGSGARRKFRSYKLSRYACYLIIQNSDPSKEIVALGQTYFATQTRKQEISENLLEDQKRVLLREDIKKHNTDLAKAADDAGVKNYGVFQNYGYMGLYGGLKAKDIHAKKGLKKSQQILDHMSSEELAANLFRATQAEAKLKREKISGEKNANNAHFAVGKKVRKTIEELGGTMPEELPATDSIGKAKTRIKKGENESQKLSEQLDN
jgi:DNA-damage-inducible protein D